MNIVMFSINPLFPDQVMGGAPKHLQNIAVYMGELGHNVTVLCTQAQQIAEPFRWHELVQVLPILRFKQPFPQPYAVPAYDLASILQDVGDYLQTADRFYMHDGEFLFPYVYRHVPTVVSLRDNVYPETLHGSFLFQGHKLVLISEYSRRYFEHSAGRFFPDLANRMVVIHNGLDWDKFKPTPPSKILEIIPVQPGAYLIVLHPHRPEETKGIRQTIKVVDLLVHQYGFNNLKALAPQWLDLQLTPELRDFYNEIEQEISERGLQDNFIFHGWIPQNLMPEYYSLGDVTLSLGSFVESFGNAVYESMGCGTPSVAARISTHRELLPDHLMDKVDYNDIEKAAELAARIITNKERTRPETLDYLHRHFSIQSQLQAYADVILEAQHVSELTYRHSPIDEGTRFKLAPWCYRSQKGIYHDFRADYDTVNDFTAVLDMFPGGFTFADAAQHSITRETVLRRYREGYLVPISGGK